MKWDNASVLAFVAGVLAMAGAGSAYAGERSGCLRLAIAADASIQARWPDLEDVIRETFGARTDVDTCARIQVVGEGPAVGLTVVLPDGRTAIRSVSRREDVLVALEALLALPEAGATGAPTDAPTAAAQAARAALPVADAATTSTPAIARLAAEPPATGRPTPFRIEIALAADARGGSGWVGAGGSAAAVLDLAHWLLGFEGRIDQYRTLSPETQSTALELIGLGGHRFRLGKSRTLDLAVGPALALHAAPKVVAQQTATGVMLSQTSSDPGLARLIVSSRLTFGAESLLRAFVQVDADIGRLGSDTQPLPEEAGMPAWTVGLALGAAVGTR
jgi:hypothetical protein